MVLCILALPNIYISIQYYSLHININEHDVYQCYQYVLYGLAPVFHLISPEFGSDKRNREPADVAVAESADRDGHVWPLLPVQYSLLRV